MSSSWNFLARASPSYEGSEPSRAELGHFNFRAEIELIYLNLFRIKNTYFELEKLYIKKNPARFQLKN